MEWKRLYEKINLNKRKGPAGELGIVVRNFVDANLYYRFLRGEKWFNILGVSFLMLMGWILIEAEMISSSGYTLGKRLFKTKVLDEYNNKLSFNQALKRSFFVWLFGMGLGIFFPVTIITGFFEIRKEKITTWDRYSKSKVIHERVGVFRVVIAIVIHIVFSILVLGASKAGMIY